MGNRVKNERTAIYAFVAGLGFVLVVGLALASVALRTARQSLVVPPAPTGSSVAAAATNDVSAPPSSALDPTKGPTAWGYEVARVMALAFPESDGGLITAGELLSLGPILPVGERVPWDKLKDTRIVQVEMSGSELLAAVASGVKYYPRKNSSFLQMFGLRALCQQREQTTQLTSLVVGEKAVLPGKTYRLAVTEFMAKGAGPFIGLKSVKVKTEPVSLVKQLRIRLFPLGRVPQPEPTYLFTKQGS